MSAPDRGAGGIVTRVLESVPAEWDAIVAEDPAATAAHRRELLEVFAGVLPGTRLRFLAVEEAGRLIGGVPVFVRRRAGLHWLHALPFLLSGAPLARAGRETEVDRAAGAALAALQRELRAVGGEWSAWRAGREPVAAAVLDAPAGETRTVETSVIELEAGVEQVLRRFDREARSRLRRARLEGLRCAEEPAAVEEVYALHLAQSRGWRGHRALPLELSRRLLASGPGAAPAARLFVVRDARHLLAGTLVLDSPRECFAWWAGARGAARSRGAAAFLYAAVAEWAAMAGRARLNLGGSSGHPAILAFKRSLGAVSVEYPVRWLGAGSAVWPVRLAAAVQRRLRTARPRGVPA